MYHQRRKEGCFAGSLTGHFKDLEFCSEWGGKPFEGFEKFIHDALLRIDWRGAKAGAGRSVRRLLLLGEPPPWPGTIITTCMCYLKQEVLVRNGEQATTNQKNLGKVKRREETPVQMSYQPPRILLTGIHLGWVTLTPPGRTLGQSDWPETTRKPTQLP